MTSERLGFAAERFFCRFLLDNQSDHAFLLDEVSWASDDLLYKFDNIVDLISDEVRRHIDLGRRPFASWILARLWFLTDGAVLVALNVNEQGEGFADGGHYMGAALIEDQPDHAIAALWIEGMNRYTQIVLTACSLDIYPEEVIQAIARTLLAQPTQIAPCRIAIADPEKKGLIHEYGWDGEKFLGIDKPR